MFSQQGIPGVFCTRPSFLLAFYNHTLPNQNQRLICSMSLFSCVCLQVVVFLLVSLIFKACSSRHWFQTELIILFSVHLFQYICSVYFRSLYARVLFHACKDRDSNQQENRRERHRCRNVSFSNLIIIHEVKTKFSSC